MSTVEYASSPSVLPEQSSLQRQVAWAAAIQEQAAWTGGQVILLAVLTSTVGLGPAGWFAGLAYAFGGWYLVNRALHGTYQLGPADRVTLARGVLVGGVFALTTDLSHETGVLVTMAAVALVLDFVDGRVARRTGTASEFGARFDMEVDAFLILVLSGLVALQIGPWVLVIGLLRYLFVGASWIAPWLRASLPSSFARKVVAALQGILLAAAASEVVPYPALLAGVALGTLLWSFGRDTLWLWINRVREEVPHA